MAKRGQWITQRLTTAVRLTLVVFAGLIPCPLLAAEDIAAEDVAAEDVAGEEQRYIQQLDVAVNSKQAKPLLTQVLPELTHAQAYGAQRKYVSLRANKDSVAGFKAGLTSAGAPERFGLSQPIVGVLFQPGVYISHASDSVLQLQAAGLKPMLETELALVFQRAINQPLDNVDELKSALAGIAAAVEIPDLGFQAKPSGLDVIAANVAASQVIIGQTQPLPATGLDQLAVTLTCGNRVLHQASAGEVSGGQWQMALWLVNQIIQQGYRIKPQQILLTGALGGMKPASVCPPDQLISADFQQLGRIKFRIGE